MSIKRKRALGLSAVALISVAGGAAGILGASASSAAVHKHASASPVTIDVVSDFTSDIARGQVLNALVNKFNAEHKGSIKVVSQTTANWPALQAKIRTEVGVGDAPDVFLYNYNPSDTTLERYGAGKLINWTPYLNADPSWKTTFPSSTLKMVRVGSDTVAIPDDQSSTVVYYNKKLFKKAGIASFPNTWEQFMADAAKLKHKGIAPVALMTADDAWLSMNVLSLLDVSYGGTNAYYGTRFNTAPLVKAATQLKTLFKEGASNAVGANYAVGTGDFLSGHAAMVFDGPWLISTIAKDIPNYCATIGAAAAPTGTAASDKHGTLVTDALTVWGAARTPNKAEQKAAVAWIKFYTSSQSAAQMATKGQFPLAVKTTLSGSTLQSANCLTRQFINLSNSAPNKVVNMERYMTPSAQAQLPSTLEQLVLGSASPKQFASTIESLNK